MNRVIFFLALGCLLQTGVWIVDAATLTWCVPTYTTGDPLPPSIAPELMYWPRWGHSPDGPWADAPYTDLLTAELPDPEKPGETHWYTVCAEYNGIFGPYAPPVSKTKPNKGGKNK